MFTIIAAVGKNLELGKNGGLIWSLPNDLKFFKEKTNGKKVFMGLNTFRSLPKKLPNREHYVLTDVKFESDDDINQVFNLEEFIKVSKDLLKDKGEFYMVHRPERLVDIFSLLRKYKIEPKELRFVYSNINKPPKLVLVKGIKNSKSFLKVDKNLYIYDDKGNYTNEILKIYNKI